jgi:pilus assembly protein CpaE
MLTAAVVSRDPKSSASLQASLQQTGLVVSVTHWDPDPNRYPATGEPVPDVVLLDLTEDPEPFFDFAAHVRRQRPTVHVVACSMERHPEVGLLLQAMRTGIQDFLAKPLGSDALNATLARFLEERGTASEGREKLIVVLGAKGGVGTTTVAVNLGVQLAQLTQKRIGLLDFGSPLGHAALLLDLQASFSIRDAIENIDRLDAHFLGGLLTQHKSGLEVLAGTAYPDEWLRITVPALVRLVHVAQAAFDFVVVDYGSVYSSESKSVLGLARAILLITQADVPSLWTLKQHISALSDLGIDSERIQIVVNRWHKRDDEALASVEKNLGRSITARLPNDFKQVSAATNLGGALDSHHSDPLMTGLRRLARKVAGIPSDAPKRASTTTGITRLFSF